jgi:hypothetical protein
VQTRQQALLEQDIASEHSTMPFRAPELFDVKTGKTLDEKVDIWVGSCTTAGADDSPSAVPYMRPRTASHPSKRMGSQSRWLWPAGDTGTRVATQANLSNLSILCWWWIPSVDPISRLSSSRPSKLCVDTDRPFSRREAEETDFTSRRRGTGQAVYGECSYIKFCPYAYTVYP